MWTNAPWPALRRADHVAAVAHHLCASVHALDRLIQVKVQRKPAVRGHHHVVGLIHAAHHLVRQLAAAGVVRRLQRSGIDSGDVARWIHRDVQRELAAGQARRLALLAMDGVAGQLAPARQRVADERGVVIAHDAPGGGHARQHQLGAAAEPGEEVRLDEPGRDAHVGVQVVAIDGHRSSGRRAPNLAARVVILRVVIHDRIAVGNVRAEHALDLFRCAWPVQAGGDHQQNLFRRHVRQLVQQRAHHGAVGRGAGDVADDDGDAIARRRDFTQWRRFDRVAQRISQRHVGAFHHLTARGLDHVDRASEIHGQAALAIGQGHAHSRSSAERRRIVCTARPPSARACVNIISPWGTARGETIAGARTTASRCPPFP